MVASPAGRSGACSSSNQPGTASCRGSGPAAEVPGPTAGAASASCASCAARAARCLTASSTRPSSPTENSGDFRARASDRSCPGDTSTSSSAIRSCTSGASCRSFFSGCWTAMCSARNSSCITARRLRLRDSTMMSDGTCPPAMRCATHRAACRHSSVSRRSSGSTRGVVRLSRQAGRGSSYDRSTSAASPSAASRAISGNASAAPVAADSVV